MRQNPFQSHFYKARNVLRYVPILIDSGGRRMSNIFAPQLLAQQMGHIFDFVERGIVHLEVF